jgi:CheY-like chemotaxis protein
MPGHDINLEPLTFLIADETDGARRILTDILLAMGARDIHSVSSFDQAEKFLTTERIDLLICDLHLGGARGPELIRTFRSIEQNPGRKIPILITCSHSRMRDVQAARDCGANLVIAKPFSVTGIYDRIAWIAHQPRKFVTSENYNGPDRRFRKTNDTVHRRRAGESSAGGQDAADDNDMKEAS